MASPCVDQRSESATLPDMRSADCVRVGLVPDPGIQSEQLGRASQDSPRKGGSRSGKVGGALSRRGLLTGALLAAGTAAAFAPARKAAASPPVGVPVDLDPGAVITRLVHRITFGANATELARAVQLGYDGYLNEQLDHLSIAVSAIESRIASGVGTLGQPGYIAPLLTIAMSGQQLFDSTVVASSDTPKNELVDATLLRAVYSKRQLFERMVEFWSDHFNIPNDEEPQRQLKILFDRNTIRPFALGTFPQLLSAMAMSPSMLNSLNNDQNRANSINENLGRELLELHTVGVLAGYTQDDIIKVARALTGWTWWSGTSTPVANRGTFRYDSTGHDVNSKVFLGSGVFPAGWTIPARSASLGQQDGIDILNYLGTHPKTAAFIAKKLCVKFLGETVSQSVIARVAAVYLNPGNPQGIGDIKAMLREILDPALLYASPMRFKRPFHLAVSALRVVPGTISSVSGLRSQLSLMGHLLFTWQQPDGYPDVVEYWGGLQLPRWNIAARLATAGVSGVALDVTTSAAGLLFTQTSASTIMAQIDSAVFLGEMPPAEKSRIQAYLPTSGTVSTTFRQEALGLALSAPGFQWY